MKKLINDNYDSTVRRGLITPSTNGYDFVDKIKEETKELLESLDDIRFASEAKQKYFDSFNEELADIILVCLNCAKHLDIDIESELKKKIEKNYRRSESI
jgi:NTP pyrophosphatase (non-canonical NTP hydrolase)